jgi:peptidoglycan hydrolase-like protein with peptidoglycan-binding domain
VEKFVTGLVMAVSLFAAATFSATTPSAAQDVGQMSMSAVPNLGSDAIRRVQQLLRERGINPGRTDGILGPLTTEAVRKFQDQYGMKASGQIDNQLLFALGAIDLAI